MSGLEVLAAVLLWAGVLLTVGCAAAAVLVRAVADRLHLLAPVTVIAGPLIGVAVAIRLGGGTATASVVLIVVLLGVIGAVLQAALGRLVVRRGVSPVDSSGNVSGDGAGSDGGQDGGGSAPGGSRR
jgi:uncharacterized membrane protein YoaK (UPF0700 family)